MDSTPPRSKLSCKNTNFKTGLKRGESSDSPQQFASTSTHNQPMDQETDYSPIYFPSTQEASDEIDVLWDWHSPQTSQKRRKKQKRLLPVQSPKIPIKRHPSNQSQNFEKLRDELRALKEELALPNDESCLCVSPQQEMEFKQLEDNNLVLKKEQERQLAQFDDMFDDSIDEQLLFFSQQIENDLEQSVVKEAKDNKQDSLSRICNNSGIDSLINKYSNKSLGRCEKMPTNDSFDLALKDFYIEDTKKTSNINTTQKYLPLQRSVSEHKFSINTTNTIQTFSGKVEFHRTKSFELEAVKHTQKNVPKCTLEEIERKRLEAKARLEAKKKSNSTLNNTVISPTKCSLEEIEKKRLQALAKREAKRLQEIVEKNRQEALKRLQITRMKKANLVKSTLTKRL